MRICMQNPINPEFSMCGDATDAFETEIDGEEFDFVSVGQFVNCEQCKLVIADIHENFTPRGKAK